MPASALAFLLARGQATGLARILLVLIALAFLANAVGRHLPRRHRVEMVGRVPANAPAPSSCNGARAGIVDTPVIRCDEASWRFLGLSFAGWNAVVSAFLAARRRLWGDAPALAHSDFKRA